VNARFFTFGDPPPRAPGTASTPEAPFLDRFSDLRGALVVGAARPGLSGNVHGTLLALGAGGSPRLLAGLAPLFELQAARVSAIAQAGAGATVQVRALGVSYDTLVQLREPDAGIIQHAGALGWSSPCRCWNARVTLRQARGRGLEFGFGLDLSSAFRGAGSVTAQNGRG
jgi:LPS-assembly protein